MRLIPEGADLKDAFAFACGAFPRRVPKKTKRQLIELQNDDKDLSDSNAERPVSEEGYSSGARSKECRTADWDLGSIDVQIVED